MADLCEAVRALAPEVALGVASAEERARVLGHVATCVECRTFLVELSAVVDDVSAVAPETEPPSGFESAVLDHLEERPMSHAAERRHARLGILAAIAAAVVAAAVAAGAVHLAGRDDRAIAGAVRRTLAVAGGEYFAAYPLLDGSGRQRGIVFGYQGDPAWVVLTFGEPLVGGQYGVELVGPDGTVHRLAGQLDPAASAAWAAELPIAIHEATELRVIDAAGREVLNAALLPP